MKLSIVLFYTALMGLFYSSNAQGLLGKPVTDFLKLNWEVEIDTKSTLPALSGNYLFTADNFAIDARTGEKIPLPINNNYDETLLIHSTDYKLKVIDVKNNVTFERKRERPYYIGSKEVEFTNDSIWFEVIRNTSIQSINLLNQKVLWTVQSPSRIFNKPVIIDNQVFVPNLNELLILDKQSGEVVNSLSLNGPVLSGIKVYENILYMIVKNKGLIAFNYNTKKIEWEIGLSKYSSRANRIVVDEDWVYFSDNNLHVVNRKNGNLIWETGGKERIYIRDSGLSKVKDYLLFYAFKDNENFLTVADKNTGEILYQGFNSNVVGGDSDNPDGVAKEDLFLIDFMDELIDDNILIGVMDNKIYGLEVLK